MENDTRAKVEIVGKMPFVRDVAYFIWGDDCIFDADGDANGPDDDNWRRLMIALRVKNDTNEYWSTDNNQRLEIDPRSGERPELDVSASTPELLEKTITFLEARGAVKRL